MSTTIDQRLTQLERQNHRLKVAVGCICLLFVACGAANTYCQMFCNVRAQRFTLVDACGNERGALELQASGEPRLVLKNSLGQSMVNIGILWGDGTNATAGLLVAGPNGSAVIKGTASNDTASWEVMQSNNRMSLRARTNEKPNIELRDDTGERAKLDTSTTPATLTLN